MFGDLLGVLGRFLNMFLGYVFWYILNYMYQKNKDFIFQKYDSDHLINRRAALLTIGKGSVFAILASRLAYLQIIENDNYSSLSDDNRITHRLLEPERGFIYDISGRSIATNKEDYQAAIIMEETININDALKAFNFCLWICSSTN